MYFFILPLLLIGLTLACPQPQMVLKALEKLEIPVKEISKIEPSKKIKNLCKVEGNLVKGQLKREVVFFVTADEKYLIPFVGSVGYKASPVKGLKEIWITSFRKPHRKFILGYLSEDGKYYIPQLVRLEQPKPQKVNKNNTNSTKGH